PLAGFEVEADSHQVVPKLPEFFERLRVSAAEIEVASIGRPGRPGFVSARRGDGWREEERVGIDTVNPQVRVGIKDIAGFAAGMKEEGKLVGREGEQPAARVPGQV